MKNRNIILLIACILCFSFIQNQTYSQNISNLKKFSKKNVKNKINTVKNGESTTFENEVKKDETTVKTGGKNDEKTVKPTGKIIYVTKTGSNKNPGTKDSPLKNLDKAIKTAEPYDKIYVAEGVYSGTFEVGYFEITKPVELYGGFNADFSKRDPLTTPTVIQTIKNKASSGVQSIFYIKETNSVVIDGFIIDMSKHNNYSNKIPEGLETGYLTLTNQGGTPKRSAIKIAGNDCIIRNNVFSNISYGGIFVMQRMNMKGKILIDNNVFVNCSQTGIEGSVLTSPNQDYKDIEISNNTFSFIFGTNFSNDNLGCAVWIKEKANFNIHHNIFAFASESAIRYLNTDKVTLKLDHNLFMNNRKNDIQTSISNKRVFISVEEFEDADFVESLEGNKRITKKLPLNPDYTREFINMASEISMQYDPNTDWNQVRSILGLPTQASGTVRISFYANKYPWEESKKLFGAVSEFGAQVPNID